MEFQYHQECLDQRNGDEQHSRKGKQLRQAQYSANGAWPLQYNSTRTFGIHFISIFHCFIHNFFLNSFGYLVKKIFL